MREGFEMKKKPSRLASKLNKRIGASDISFSVDELGLKEKKMCEFINEMVAVDESRRIEIIQKYFKS